MNCCLLEVCQGDLNEVSYRLVFIELEKELELPMGGLDNHKDEIKEIFQDIVEASVRYSWYQEQAVGDREWGTANRK